MHQVGSFIAQKRKERGLTQQKLAEKLNISFQAISKWENGTSSPDIALLPEIANILGTSVDALVGYRHTPQTIYQEKYSGEDFYWGLEPNSLCYEIMKLKPPTRPYRVLDIGCGEGIDALFLARNGYQVSAFDLADAGLEKARQLAQRHGIQIDFFRADVNEFTPEGPYDIVFSSGVLHYVSLPQRKKLIDQLKAATAPGGLHALNVFVPKPFIAPAPDLEEAERQADPWHSGELFTYYHDWLLHRADERIFDCESAGIPHQHCMDTMIAEKKTP